MTEVIGEKKMVFKKALLNVVCNLCRKSCKSGATQEQINEWQLETDNIFSYATLSYSGGFFSNFDSMEIKWHFCEDCLVKIGKIIKENNGDFSATYGSDRNWSEKINDTNDS